ncbi:sacsin-like [Leptodactylus fuscus]|uniref:sacsin-like n=1 Tax=Leptodactylus fuscus TaxID=238119 RepID=UPI003F4EF057
MTLKEKPTASTMDFFQRAPPFLIQLQNILRKYPDGGQILKELIQNADDAKASEVVFVYDEREYGTDILYAKEQHVIQGPSLLAYNNEIFSDRDWDGIQRPGNSIKRKDPNTVGRFGLGFNSVYHMTDYPAIFSGKNIGILDPQENIFHRGGCLWNIEKKDKFSEDLKDQFEPFKSVLEPLGLGSWEKILNAGYFKGTLFCFPFRLCPSEISDNLYSAERVEELFESFMKDSNIALLFLRHVTSITLKKIGKDGIVKTLLAVNVSSKTLLDNELAGVSIQTLSKVISLRYMDNEEEESEWLVTTSNDLGKLYPELSELSIKLCNKPVLDLAYPLSKQKMDLFGGRLNCILPLPDKEENQTGLPCLINGCFDLTDDRRSLKWPETDQQHDEGAKWNQILVEKVLPIIYTMAVTNGVTLVNKSKLTVDMAYGIWPDPEKTTHKSRWHGIVSKVARCLEMKQVLQTTGTCRWITTQEAVFVIVENVEIRTCLEELLLLLKVPLVKVPDHVFKILCMVQKDTSHLNIVTPDFVRHLLRKDDWLRFPAEKKLLLLEYIIEDGKDRELLNLKLLPLSDGSFTSFQNTESNGMVYIDSKEFPRTLLPGLAHRFIPEDLPHDLHVFFVDIGKSRIFKNLVCLSVDVIRKTLHQALPQKWLGTDKVHWHPGDPDHPPVEWIETMWTFLQQYNDILGDFENQPIVPLSQIQSNSNDILLARLQRKKILFQNSDGHNIPKAITAILERAGCTIIWDKNAWMWHKNLHLFISTPTPNNVLQTLSKLNLNQVLEVFKSTSKKHGKMFCDFFSQAYQFNSSELEILYKLPIFSSVKTTTSSESKLVAARCLTALDCNTIPAVPDTLAFPDVVIKCKDESEKRLLQLMKIQLLNAVDVALKLVKAIHNGSYTNHQSEAQNVMLWILQNGYALFTQSDKLKSMCRNLSFIPCNGHLRSPSNLYDPKVETFRVLFEADKFPPAKYHEDSILMSLRMLGLLDSVDKITAEDVLKIAQQLNQSKETTSVLKKADCLVEVCNSTTVLAKFSSHISQLRNLAWVRAVSKRSKKELEKPVNMRSFKYFNIVEFSMPLTNSFTEKANDLLGLNDLPPPKKVVENLTVLSLNYKSMDQYSFYRKLHDLYKYIQDHITQFQKDLLKEVVIWNGNDFSLPLETVLCYPEGLDLSSYVNKVPSDFLTYKSLFTRCGVKSSLPNDEVIHILYTLKDRMDKDYPYSGSLKELKLVIAILDWMKANAVCGTDELPIPVQSNKRGFSLKPLSKALYCDMEKQHIASAAMDYDIVHEEISMATARYLNIQLLSTKVLKPEFFDLWGPSEPVTLRIKNILREYSEQVEIFKEMIQNAEDANATTCHFLVDMRQNSEIRKKLIDPGMASCHGPALWSYNNSKFTEADFINIIRIGAATKEHEVQKIGKFGLGFNTVYHITDVPSIMSGSKVLIFDPNANHLQKHITQLNPGMKLDLQNNSEVLHIFADQFQPFSDVFGCKLAQPFYFDGTLIRLPFRTEEEARETEICHQAFTEKQIHELMTDFKNSSETLLIFLKNVKEASLSHLYNGQCPGFQTVKVHLQKETVQKLPISQDVPLQQEQLSVSRQLCKQLDSLDIDCTNIVKISAQKTNTTDDKFYIIQSGLGVKKSVKNFMQNENQSCLPIAGVALPLEKNPSTGKWSSNLEGFQGLVFCFLPLPVSTGLPFHINGTFSVMSNRKSLWETTVKGEWNKHLLGDPVLVAVITALLQLQAMNKNGDLEDYYYYTFWPDVTKVNTHFMEMVKSFYHAVAFGLEGSLPPLFSNGQECCTMNHACFLDLEMFEDETIQHLAKKVFSEYLKKPYLAIDLPDWVNYSFSVSNSSSELQKNWYSCERFYREIVFENLDCLEMEERNALIIYAIDLNTKELNGLLISKPCIPTSLHGNLQFITNLVHPKGKVSPLYDPEEGCFPEGEEFLERLEALHALGLLKDKLPLKKLKEKACKIKNIWTYDRKKALKQIVCILELLHDLLKEQGWIEDQSFRDIIFLPAVPPQSNAVQLNDLTLMKAKDLYHSKHKALVSMIYPILNLDQPDDVTAFLGIDRQPSSQIVLSQLQKASEAVNLLNDDESLSIAKGCYSYLNEFLEEEPNNADLIKEQASAFPFVYIDGEFVPVNLVAHTISFDASPYLYKLPKQYEKFANLWDNVEICQEFSFLHYFSVLEKMAIEHQETPLSARELSLAMDLINHSLEKIPDSIASRSFDISKVFVPDMKCILRHVDKIFYNDTPWLPYNNQLNFCNELIPRAVVSKLGVKTRIHHTLQKLKISSLSNWGSEFGSRERLTTRIKNILKEYSSKKDIVKELLQNADDAEASEIHFVLDNRQHKTKRVFGLEWHPLQGPALCVYNNKKFNDQDIEGIQQLGIGGKEDDLDKTGKFGLGFNSVYHITDCPSFVTADTMMGVFDPNLIFLDSSDDTSPGRKFNIIDEFKETFRDVYDTFLPSMFNLQEGTIFRLPLRMANTVAMSEISNHTVSLEDIRKMCEELDKDDNMILFLNHIRKITFSEISRTGDVKEIFSVETKIDEANTMEISSFQQRLCNYVKNKGCQPEHFPFRISSTVQVERSSSRITTHWLIVRQLGIVETDGSNALEETSKNLDQILIPHGSIAACLNKKVKGRAFCTLPLPVETGLPVHVNANFIVDSARRNICKEDGDSPKTAWNMLLLSNLIAPLYCYLLQCLCDKIKRNLLHFQSFDSCKLNLDDFLSFFPTNTEHVTPQWRTVVTQVYLTIFEHKMELIPVYKNCQAKKKFEKESGVVEWSHIGKSSIIEEPIFFIPSENKSIEPILHKINMQLAYGEVLYKSFKEVGVNVLKLSPQTLCHFLKEIPLLPNGHALPAPVSSSIFRNEENCNSLLKYCVKDHVTQKVDLQGVPLLVTVDGLLHHCDREKPKFPRTYSALFPKAGHEFIKSWEYSTLETDGFVKRLDIKSSVALVKNHLGPMYEISPNANATPLPLPQDMVVWLKGLWSFFWNEVKRQKTSEKEKHFKDIFAYFKQWAILPVHRKMSSSQKDDKYILPLADLRNICFPCSSDITQYLLKLGFPELELSVFYDSSVHLETIIPYLKPYMLNTENLELVLVQLCSIHDLKSKLKGEELDNLLYLILIKLQSEENKVFLFQKLKSLPLFETFDGQRRSLDMCRDIYLLATSFDLRPFRLSDLHPSTIYLKKNSHNELANKFMKIPLINDLDLLTGHLLSDLASFNEKQLLHILRMVLDLQCRFGLQNKEQQIFASLKSARLIKDKRGELQMASYFYDHKVNLFAVLELQDRFIPKNFWKEFERSEFAIRHLLINLGMKDSLSESDFIKFATEIEKNAKGNYSFESLHAKAKALYEYLLSMDLEKISDTFVSTVRNIAFVNPSRVDKKLNALHPPFTENVATVALQGSMLNVNGFDSLVWTSLPLLSKSTHVKKVFCEKFGILKEPPITKVIDNIKNVCKVSCGSKDLQKTRSEVLQQIYGFLQKKGDDIDVTALKDIQFILVNDEKDIAFPKQVAFNLHMERNLCPYLYKLPPLLACYSKLFQKVGVEAEPSVFHFADVLSTIHSETLDKSSLHPNLITTVSEATKQLFELVEGNKDTEKLHSLHLLAHDGKLYESSSLVLNNCRSSYVLSKKLSCLFNFVYMNSLFNIYQQENLLKRLPKKIRPRMLSDITQESLTFDAQNLCSFGDQCPLKLRFEKLFFSKIFQEGLVCLLQHQTRGKMSKEAAMEKWNLIFGMLEITCCSDLQTVLLYDEKPLEGTQCSKMVFAIKNGGCKIYFQHSDSMELDELVHIAQVLAKEMNNLMENVLTSESMSVVNQMLSCHDPSGISKVLKRNDLWNNITAQNTISLPNPGEKIPSEWIDCLDMSITNTFRVGDYVGYLIPSEGETYLYAVIEKELGTKTLGSCEIEMYLINIGQNKIEVSVLDLYQFKRSEGQSVKSLVLLENPPPVDGTQSSRQDASIEDLKKEIDLDLNKIWGLPKNERMTAIRRLYLKYHPDKNINREQVFTEACKYLQQRIKEKESGKTMSNCTSSSGYRGTGGFSNFWEKWNNQAHNHRYHREHFSRRTRCNYDFWGYHSSSTHPKPQEADRWLKQAICDLKAAEHDVGHGHTEWVFYKVHQAVEKACFAAQYLKVGEIDKNVTIVSLAHTVSSYSSKLRGIHDEVKEMKACGVDKQRTQYPNCYPPPGIPNNRLDPDHEERVIALAKSVVKKIESYILG